jgi:hypothetical protein
MYRAALSSLRELELHGRRVLLARSGRGFERINVIAVKGLGDGNGQGSHVLGRGIANENNARRLCSANRKMSRQELENQMDGPGVIVA